MTDSTKADIERVLRDIVAPLVESDGSEIYLVAADSARIELHLAGRLTGAPGNSLFCRKILEPALRAVVPNVEVALSAGWRIPTGAVILESSHRR